MAVSALTVLLSNCLEESQFVSAPTRRKRLVLEGPQAALLGTDSEEDAAGDACDAPARTHRCCAAAPLCRPALGGPLPAPARGGLPQVAVPA